MLYKIWWIKKNKGITYPRWYVGQLGKSTRCECWSRGLWCGEEPSSAFDVPKQASCDTVNGENYQTLETGDMVYDRDLGVNLLKDVLVRHLMQSTSQPVCVWWQFVMFKNVWGTLEYAGPESFYVVSIRSKNIGNNIF